MRVMDTAVTHQAAITEFVDADGVSYAYRRFGQPGKARWCCLRTSEATSTAGTRA
jgi:hypothetical protein